MTHLTRSLWLYGLEKTPIIRWANWWANQNLDNQKSKEYQQVFRFLQEVVRPQSRPSRSSVLQEIKGHEIFSISVKHPRISRNSWVFSFIQMSQSVPVCWKEYQFIEVTLRLPDRFRLRLRLLLRLLKMSVKSSVFPYSLEYNRYRYNLPISRLTASRLLQTNKYRLFVTAYGRGAQRMWLITKRS